MSSHEMNAYNCYHSVLNTRAGAERVGARKQHALKVASDRYRIPMGELKRFILKTDRER